jgi:hypothetical protein
MGIRTTAQAGWVAVAAFATSLSVPACHGRPQPAADEVDPQERLNVISNPSMYLDTGNFAFDDEASDFEKLLAMSVTNKAHFAVHGLEGDVLWLDDDGRRLGSSRFALTGSVPAFGSKTFSTADGTMTSGSLRGGALKVTITFTHVEIGE